MIGEECLVQVYHELSDQPVSQMDPWVEMQANLETLQDLQQRLSFALREVRYLLKAKLCGLIFDPKIGSVSES